MKRTILLVEYNEEMLEFIADDRTSFISTNTQMRGLIIIKNCLICRDIFLLCHKCLSVNTQFFFY